MVKKISFLLMLISFSILLCLMSSTYSRYVANAQGNINGSFSKWQILVNTDDITSQTNSEITIEPVIEEQANILSNVMAPSSKGYFDISIDPTNVDVSFKYVINLEMEDENIPDIMITKYALLPDSYIEGGELDYIYLEDGVITNTLTFNKSESFRFKPFTIRLYFEWYDGEDEAMNDEADSHIGYLAATENTTFKLGANISFEQVIN